MNTLRRLPHSRTTKKNSGWKVSWFGFGASDFEFSVSWSAGQLFILFLTIS